jgi:hypothetical protein
MYIFSLLVGLLHMERISLAIWGRNKSGKAMRVERHSLLVGWLAAPKPLRKTSALRQFL